MTSVSFVMRALAGVAIVALLTVALPTRAATPVVYSVAPGIDVHNLDTTCKACDDFYQFATGGWQKAHAIPTGYPMWGPFAALSTDNLNVERAILEDAAQNTTAPRGSATQKIGTFYHTCMDESGIEAAGTSALQPELDHIAAMQTPDDILAESERLSLIGVRNGIALAVGPDQKDSSKQLLTLFGGILGLPDRDYYLKDDARSTALRAAYIQNIVAILGLLGDDTATAQTEAHNILALETIIAQATPTREELRDAAAIYHPTPFAELSSAYPGVDWSTLLATAHVAPVPIVNILVPAKVRAAVAQYHATPLQTWKAYDRYSLFATYGYELPKKFNDAMFAFGAKLNGTTEQRPRWQRCVGDTDDSLTDAVGAVYIAQTFGPAAKARVLAIVDSLQGVLADDIKTLDWMSAPTKERALKKLGAFTKKIGYPDTFADYSSVNVSTDSYLANEIRTRMYAARRVLDQLGEPTDRARWGLPTSAVDAYYSSSNNEIVFPAGILHPPYFSEQTDDAVNYGAIGAVIGHEMTHGFDDQGRRYDEKGNVTDWWAPADATNFQARAQCIIDEFNGFEVVPGEHEQGVNVQGEAIADLGGATIAYKAFERTAQAKSGIKRDGYTPQQRFFLAYAQIWAAIERDDYKVTIARTNPHPEARFRVLGTLSNMPEFRAAFACTKSDPMVRAKQCQIW